MKIVPEQNDVIVTINIRIEVCGTIHVANILE